MSRQNPKDLVGAKKAPLGLVPPALEIGAAEAMADGAVKYGPYNWRIDAVEYMTYLEAIKRHVLALIDGQDLAVDSGIHHLKHIVAGAGILLDALPLGQVVDNRPPKGPAADLLRAQDKSVRPDEEPWAMVRHTLDQIRAEAAIMAALDGTEGGDVVPGDLVGCQPEDCDGEDCGMHNPVTGLL